MSKITRRLVAKIYATFDSENAYASDDINYMAESIRLKVSELTGGLMFASFETKLMGGEK